ncbi:hypothetical protein [Parvularcula sp. LCG005]|uniref:hypothetical protein n=1 Tax=Parvularcula sp. LCG005 TaxID=3078805 RepID=UPI002943695E|nr:hypothetical protein [Parvularcula sp. LCG005]WOI54450.1 hypothetical protein RUI03_05465 [Parvularcula sp. LCG005]
MERYRYGEIDDRRGVMGWMTGLILAIPLSVGAFLGGRWLAGRFCEGTACEAVAPASDVLLQNFEPLGDMVSWAVVIAIGLGVLVWFALASYPRKIALAFVLLLAIAFLGFMVPGQGDEIIDIIEEPLEDVLPVTTAAATPIPVEPECPAGNFFNGAGCSPCTETAMSPQPSALYFAPLKFDAAWQYADDQRYYRLADTAAAAPYRALTDLVIDGSVSAGGQAVCASGAILVIGSSSSDGPLDRNRARAKRRADHLASQVARTCPNATAIYALSLGQSTASVDTDTDRMLTVIGLDTPDGSPVTRAKLEQELGYVLSQGTHGATLLSRHDSFPQSGWEWVEGASGKADIRIMDRPYETITRLREDAPDTCLTMSASL